MPTWEETKRAGQTAFISQENGLQDVHESIGDMYRQILSTGYIYPWAGAESLTRQIAEGNIELPEAQQPEISRSVEQEQDIEPER
jgi:hypothetical protein